MVREVQVLLADGDRSTMTIEPLSRRAARRDGSAGHDDRRGAAGRGAARWSSRSGSLGAGGRRSSIALRARYVADLSAFLPSAPTPEQAVLLDQLKSGSASRLILVGIEGGDAGDAAARALAAARRAAAARDAALRLGRQRRQRAPGQHAGRFVFEHRYALSPAVDADALQVDGLRDGDRRDRLALLGTPAGCADQADPAARPDRRDGAHRRGDDAGAGAEDRRRRLGLAQRAARRAGG